MRDEKDNAILKLTSQRQESAYPIFNPIIHQSESQQRQLQQHLQSLQDRWPESSVAKKRKTRDLLFAILFVGFIGSLAYAVVDVVSRNKGNPSLFIKGYDNYGNICGQENRAIPGVPLSGVNMQRKNFLMITLHKNISLRASCVSTCPPSEFLASILNRCLPRETPIKLPALVLMDALNASRSFVEAVVSDTAVCWKEVTYSASISFLISLFVLILLRFVASIVIWFSLMGLAIASALGTIYVWIRWKALEDKLRILSSSGRGYMDGRREAERWFIGAIAASLLWILFVILIIFLRKKIQMAAKLFREAGRAIGYMPCLLLQPFWTFFLLCGISIAWLVGLVYLQSVRHPVVDPETGFVHYRLEEGYRLLKWPYLFAIVWIFHFLVACQHFVTGSSVCRWYFLKHKQELESPIIDSYWILFRYSLGSIALGSLVVSGIKLLRLLFQRIEKMVKNRDGSCSGPVRCCNCFLWIFERLLVYVNTNAYIEIALTGKSFCSSARRAFTLLTLNALTVTAVNSVGDFLLFVSKVMIVLVTLWTGNKLVEDREAELAYSWSPLIVSGLSAYFVAHCFLSVYEMAIDALFICFCENRDADSSDSSNTRPYFANRTLVDFDEDN